MKYMIPVILIVFSVFAQGDELTMLTDLASLKWEHRVILINEAGNEQKALALLDQHTAEINDRDIVWFMLKEDRAFTNYAGDLLDGFSDSARKRYKLERGTVILIGKDGGVKSRLDHLDLEFLFTEIDAMPMRQREMQY